MASPAFARWLWLKQSAVSMAWKTPGKALAKWPLAGQRNRTSLRHPESKKNDTFSLTDYNCNLK